MKSETAAKEIFGNCKNIMNTYREYIIFGITQANQAFRNEMIIKNFIFKIYKFAQMAMRFFVKPETHAEWPMHCKEKRLHFYAESLEILKLRLYLHQYTKNKLAHYAANFYDIENYYPFVCQELENIHNHGNFD